MIQKNANSPMLYPKKNNSIVFYRGMCESAIHKAKSKFQKSSELAFE